MPPLVFSFRRNVVASIMVTDEMTKMTMKNRNTVRGALRVCLFAGVFLIPAIGMATADRADKSGMSGAGFVLYVSVVRP